jgi:Tol biopolymer transport system component
VAPIPRAAARARRPAPAAAAGAVLLAAAAAVLAAAAPRPARFALDPRAMGARAADSLIQPGETHFAHLWQITFGGENAEGYFSSDGSKLIYQSTRDGYPCDRMFVMDLATGTSTLVSTGTGRTTCGYFYDRDRRVLFASTHLGGDSCPPVPDFSQGYVWPLHPSFDLFTAKPDGSDLRRLTATPGYDAEATVSPDGRRIVFTSTRDGDIELYTMRPDGSDVARLTAEPGYDGGAFYSRDGRWICWRRDDQDTPEKLADYRRLLAQDLVRPSSMHLWVMRADGSGKRRVTRKPGASFAPYFTPDGRALIYSSNWENPRGRDFDLYRVDVAGGEPQPVTRHPEFDGFPMFSPDGRWLVFASNRGGTTRGETNLFLAEWRP